MTSRIGTRAALLAAFVIAACAVQPAVAQTFTGMIDVVVSDATGKPLPRVALTLTGPFDATGTSDVAGRSRFNNLPVGIYAIKGTLDGFTPFANGHVRVVAAAVTAIAATLSPTSGAADATPVSGTAVVDPAGAASTTHVMAEDLDRVPYVNDVWTILQRAPSIYEDRVNVGGA